MPSKDVKIRNRWNNLNRFSVTVRLTAEEKRAFEEICRIQRKSANEILLQLIAIYLKVNRHRVPDRLPKLL